MTKFQAKDGSVDSATVDLVALVAENEKLAAARVKNAERQRKLRERRAAEGKQSVTVVLPADVIAFLNQFVQFKDMSKDRAIETAIRSALMRKR